MEILPAIDLRGGKCVRLIQGDYQREIQYSHEPAELAAGFQRDGARWIHVVDLDGARQGKIVNLSAIKLIAESTKAKVEVGGGVRSLQDIQQLLDAGISRVILGTKALQDWPWFEKLLQRPELSGKLVLSLDARQGQLAVRGWTEKTEQTAVEFARRVQGQPLAAIIYTDITRDGMLAGANIEATEQLARATSLPVIAAGGVTSPADVKALARLPLAGIIIGRALYEGRITLSQALSIVARQT